MDSNSRKRSRKSKLVLRQVIELDEELQKILDISQDIQKPDENYLINDYSLKVEKIEDDEPPEFEEEDETPMLPSTEILQSVLSDTEMELPKIEKDTAESNVIPLQTAKKLSLKCEEQANDLGINNDHTYSMQEATTNIQFSVNIEVEEFDDENIDTDCLNIDESCDYGYRIPEISVRKDLFIDPNNESKKLDLPNHVVNNIIVGKHMIESRIEALPEHIVNSIILGDDYQKDTQPLLTDPLLNPLQPLLTPLKNKYNEECLVINDPIAFSDELKNTVNEFKNPIDEVLKLFAINNYGIHVEDKHVYHPIDYLLETALNTWMVWYRITKNQPVSYKCYICKKAWWYLNDFREHLKERHNNIGIDMEINDALCNIVAFDSTIYSKLPTLVDIPIKGKCVTCNREYFDHLKITCAGCHYKFATCGIYIKHIYQCRKYVLKQDKKIINYCKLCFIHFFDETSFEEHFTVMHLVRSDIPMPRSSLSKCQNCDLKVPYCKPHGCVVNKSAKKRMTCIKCLYRYNNPYMLRLHNNNMTYKCSVCSFGAVNECAYLSHIIKHTSEFVNGIKCQMCKEFTVFHNLVAFKQHIQAVHNECFQIRDWKLFCAQQILLPKKLYSKYTCNVHYSLDEDNNIISRTADNANISIKNEIDKQTDTHHENTVIQEFEKPFTLNQSNTEPKCPPQREIKKAKKNTNDRPKQFSPQKEIKKPKKTPNEESEDSSTKIAYEEVLSTIFGNGEAIEAAGEEDGLDVVMVKTEIKEEPFDYELFAGSFGMNFLNEEAVEQSASPEPEIIMGEMILKRTYCCKTCGFIGYHKQYKDHIASNTCKKHTQKYKLESQTTIYRCTKCYEDFHTLKPYILHLTKHGFKLRSCPECLELFSTNCKLICHLQMHIRDLYLRLIFLTEDQMKQNFCYQCRICKLRITENDFFEHWEGHLEFKLEIEEEIEVDLNEKETEVDNKKEMDSRELDSDDTSYMINAKQMKAALQQLQKHRRAFDRSNDMKCGLCSKEFSRKMDHKRHIIEHLLMEAYSKKPSNAGLKCQICGEIFQKADAYKQHMRNHGALPIYRCELCNKSFSDSSNFAKHKKVHNLKVLICDHCGKKFHQKATLETHMQLHIKNELFPCTDCSQKFLTLSKRRKHIRRVHENIKPKFKCMICRKSFISLKYKWDHEWNAHKERHIQADCPKCGKKFRKMSDVKRHVAEDHETKAVIISGKRGVELLHITVD